MSNRKTFDDLTDNQRRACHAFNQKFGTPLHDVAANLDAFFRLSRREITPDEFERQTGIMIQDKQTLSMRFE